MAQAHLDMHLALLRTPRPEELDDEDLLDVWAAWWDAEHPRISDATGEYRGWSVLAEPHEPVQAAVFLGQDSAPKDKSHADTRDTVDQEQDDPAAVWRRAELDVARSPVPQRLAGTSASDRTNMDPYSFVLAKDVRELLYVPHDVSTWSVTLALDAFLQHLGLPSALLSRLRGALEGPDVPPPVSAIRGRLLPRLAPCTSESYLPSQLWDGITSNGPAAALVQSAAWDWNALFPVTSFDPRGPNACLLPPLSSDCASRAERCLAQMTSVARALDERAWATQLIVVHAMVCVAAGDAASGRRRLRSALAEEPEDYLLWYAYAQWEMTQRGRADLVHKVGTEVLCRAPARTLSALNQRMCERLWVLWAECLWCTGDWPTSRAVLQRAADAQFQCAAPAWVANAPPVTDAAMLRVLRSLRANAHNDARVYACALAEHMAGGERVVGDALSSSMAAFDRAFECLGSSTRVGVAQAWLRFLQVSQRLSHPPSILARERRAMVTKLVRACPEVTAFVYALQQQEHVHDRLDRHVALTWHSVLGDRKYARDELCWLVALCLDLPSLSLARARAWADRAVQAQPRSSLLWHTAIEIERREAQRSTRFARVSQRIRSLVYQAVRYCPFDKSLLLLATDETLRPAFAAHELRTLVAAGEEHQLRMYHDLTPA